MADYYAPPSAQAPGRSRAGATSPGGTGSIDYEGSRRKPFNEGLDISQNNEDRYDPNPFLSTRAPGYAEQAARLQGTQAHLIDEEAMDIARRGARGELPSKAELLMRDAMQRGQRAAMAQSATGRGNPYLAQRAASQAVGDMTTQVAAQAGAMRADEMAKYSDMLLKYSGMNADFQNRVMAETNRNFNQLLAQGWDYDTALREVANNQQKIINDWRLGVLEDHRERALDQGPASPQPYSGPVSPQAYSGRTRGPWSPGDIRESELDPPREAGGPEGEPDEDALAEEQRRREMGSMGGIPYIDIGEGDSRERWVRSGPPPEKDPSITDEMTVVGSEDPYLKLEQAELNLKKTADIVKYIDALDRYGSAAKDIFTEGPHRRDEAMKDVAAMGAKDLTGIATDYALKRYAPEMAAGTSAVLSGVGGSLAGGLVGAARIAAADRMSPREKREAMGRVAVGAGASGLATAAASPLGPAAPLVGAATGGVAQNIYDYILS